jgi:hypothetical protein
MNDRRAENFVHALEQWIGAYHSVTINGAPISLLQQARGFLVLATQMMVEQETKDE